MDNPLSSPEPLAAVPPPEYGSFTDPRDGRTYRTVKIGGQVWMAENLAYNAEGGKAYGNDPANGAKYGRLYNWETAMKVCPQGWHLPSNEEWDTLVRFADGSTGTESPYDSKTAGKKLKAKRGWNNDGNGTDELGFSALPGGYGLSNGSFVDVGDFGYWWSATENDSGSAYSRNVDYDDEGADWGDYDKDGLLSVRCVQDAGEAV
jgi:uncharacterized protein (TIGR02145 family)